MMDRHLILRPRVPNPHMNRRHLQALITSGTLAGAVVTVVAPQLTTLGLSINLATNLAWIWIESKDE